MVRYFEDVEVGETTDCGSVTVTRDEIVEFAQQYDPQPFHLDEEAAKASIFGGLVASGWHTAALCMRRIADALSEYAFAGARGVDELRWHRPVRPGTTLSVEVVLTRKDPSGGRSEIGDVDFVTRGQDDAGRSLISWTSLAMMYRANDRSRP